ncbi:hypothetical protein EOS_01700 [Caballeronia mineralivorans PML1(12)]|uniref:Uncharacterized protein n=1 Tax=Caballeronia mineralivorans PML1(12) TaxID=908627 RepID=A0A0J1D5N9_9BURK|nr:hypothetical protein [Caballeronia mineralivorans]KLU27970.1 hypothetical protein EOS_01700 [Caballeronia mineralivorans PML1(12)]
MDAPLVVVQGDLLLPTLFPLAGMPNAIYGEEWTLTSVRAALTEYEIPFYAARFLAAYVSPLSLRNDRFPYTPASLWGKFKRNDEIDHASPRVPPIPANATPQAVEPAPFAFEPFTAPDDHHVKAPVANHDHRKQLAGGAIALACAAFIAWALFGTKIGHQDAQTQKPKLVLSATPVVKPMPDSETVHASGASSATVAVASASPASATSATSAAPSATATIAALPAVQKPIVVSGASGSSKPLESTSTIASHGQSATPNTVSDGATKPRTIAQTVERNGSKAKAKSKRDAHRYEVVHRRHGHQYQGAPVYRSAGHETPLASAGRRTLSREDTRANTGSSSLSVTDMYNMLAHSAVLDDNSGASREPVRAAPREPASLPSQRSSASDTPSSNSGLSQRRVTDTPSQFSK